MGYFVSKHGFVFFATTCPVLVCVLMTYLLASVCVCPHLHLMNELSVHYKVIGLLPWCCYYWEHVLLHPLTLIWFKVDFVCIFYSDVDLELPIRWAFQKKNCFWCKHIAIWISLRVSGIHVYLGKTLIGYQNWYTHLNIDALERTTQEFRHWCNILL